MWSRGRTSQDADSDRDNSLKSFKLVQLVNQLVSFGAQQDLPSLPVIVVAGNQSVGKSSLLYSICGLGMPRGEGSVTRCPIEIRCSSGICLEPSESWRAVVKLRKEWDETGQRISTTETAFGETTDRQGVEALITRAQKALLNPSRHHKGTKDELFFSPNVIVVEIYGAGFDLTLVDLPGLVKSVREDQDDRVIVTIEDCVKDYLRKEKVIILAVITCSDEMENQAIFHMAREVDPLGKRTLGVLTKPDRIEEGGHQRWIDVLEGKVYALKLGYHLVKMPSMKEKSATASSDEKAYFNNHKIWSNSEVNLGVDGLRDQITKLLSELIEECIPGIRSVTERELHDINNYIESLPPLPKGDQRLHVLQVVRQFSSLINFHIKAEMNLKVFSSKIRRWYESFKEEVETSRPCFNSSSDSPTGFWRKSSSTPPQTNKKYGYTIEEMRHLVHLQKGKEMDGVGTCYSAFEQIVRKAMEEWRSFTMRLVEGIGSEVGGLVGKVGGEVFSPTPKLWHSIRSILQTWIERVQRDVHAQIGYVVAMEAKSIFTLDSIGFMKRKQDVLDGFGSATGIETSTRTEAVKRAIGALQDAGVRGLTPQMLMNRVLPGSDSGVVDLMASSMAYYDLASRRLVDTICLHVEFHYLERFGEMLEQELVEGLGVLDKNEEDVKDWIREDSAIAKRRKKAEEKKGRYEKIMKSLQDFGYSDM